MSDLTRRGFIACLGGVLAAPQLTEVSGARIPVHFVQLDGTLLAAHVARLNDDDTFVRGIRRNEEITFTVQFPARSNA